MVRKDIQLIPIQSFRNPIIDVTIAAHVMSRVMPEKGNPISGIPLSPLERNIFEQTELPASEVA